MIDFNDEKLVTCPCGNRVGELVQVGDLPLLSVNGILVRSLHGVCSKCSRDFHYSVSDRLLHKLVQKIDKQV